MSKRPVVALFVAIAMCVTSVAPPRIAQAEPMPPLASGTASAPPATADAPVGAPEAAAGPEVASTSAAASPPRSYLGPQFRKRELFRLPSPRARSLAVGAFDVKHNVDVLFGGSSNLPGELGTALGDTWTWDAYKWNRQLPKTSPPARSSAVMAYVPWLGYTVLFGGVDPSGRLLNDTWSWNGVTWTQKFPMTSPPARRDAAGTYVGGAVHSFEVFGGMGATEAANDLWRWTGTNWTLVPTTGAPARRAKASMAYSPILDRTVVFGGDGWCTSAGCTSSTDGSLDTWVLSGSAWTKHSPTHHPPAGAFSRLVYNPALSIIELFGAPDIFAWTGADWVIMVAQRTGMPAEVPASVGTGSIVVLGPAATPEFLATGQLMVHGGAKNGTFWDTYSYDWFPYGERDEFDLDQIPLSAVTTVYVNRGTIRPGIRTVDISLDGLDGPFAIERRYAFGGDSMSSALPAGWMFTTGEDLRLTDLPDGDKIMLGEAGSMLWFDKQGSTYVTPHGIDATLTGTGDDFELTYNDSGRVLTFIANRLVSDRNIAGHAVIFAYVDNRLWTITDTRGVVLTFAYTMVPGRTCADGICPIAVVSAITDSGNRTWQYRYNSDGLLVEFVDAAGEVTTYEYGLAFYRYPLNRVTTPDGHWTGIEYWVDWLSLRNSPGADNPFDWGTWARVIHGTTQRTRVAFPEGRFVIADDDWWTRPYQPA